jgi:NTP pyrophosphatase (non-canonical NTP hydrolase)
MMKDTHEHTLDGAHAEMVRSLAKDGDAILADMDGADAHLLHMAVGVAGEAGELLDAIKKGVIYRKPIDMPNVIEELGDLEFYMSGVRDALGISREQCLQANMDKLSVRYAGGTYSDEDARARADKGDGEG